jgi:DNA-binding transcriptional ArsR family regulator
MDELDSIIHQPSRLQIMSALCQLPDGNRVDFTYLRDLFKLTDGNLGAHLATLETAGYIEVMKEFVVRKPKTFFAATSAGRKAFTGHVAALQAILSPR